MRSRKRRKLYGSPVNELPLLRAVGELLLLHRGDLSLLCLSTSRERRLDERWSDKAAGAWISALHKQAGSMTPTRSERALMARVARH
jgi:hypothetical protein